ncbi:transporter [Hymenobacter qilianensis]|uniref:Transporter n=2 Tax=Hymenobacter qilianensis TaxID=1385715 RepID=A0ACB5PP02_9BACT|nr:cation transporter [Hymenobacter qilianensis]QNP53288.1 cation transporter [Hymenobacter qilianensis]GGF57989.1 transporter [Hymenobacter qilianensis]
MNKSIFHIANMDCSAEEQLIRMKLVGNEAVEGLHFDLPGRQLTIFHTGAVEPLAKTLEGLRLNSTLIATADAGLAELTEDAPADRRLLWTVLGINFFFFVLEALTGFLAHSIGLLADALDMLADALVYGLALYAVSRIVSTQKRVAKLSGYFQLALAVGGLVEVLRRFAVGEQEPDFGLMMGISALALVGNSASLYLLQKSRSQQVHMQASQVFTSNDVIANMGVIVAGGLVYVTGSAWPDLLIGLVVFALVARGAFRIFQLAK